MSSLDLNSQKISSKQCIHTKHIYSLLDTPKGDEIFKRLSKHMETCGICAAEFNRFKTKTLAAQVYIPKVVMDRDIRESFERELGELFKVMNLNQSDLLKKNMREKVRFLDKMGADFLANLLSKNMIKVYVVAAAMFFGLKYFF